VIVLIGERPLDREAISEVVGDLHAAIARIFQHLVRASIMKVSLFDDDSKMMDDQIGVLVIYRKDESVNF